jgi:hypothetical protein
MGEMQIIVYPRLQSSFALRAAVDTFALRVK